MSLPHKYHCIKISYNTTVHKQRYPLFIFVSYYLIDSRFSKLYCFSCLGKLTVLFSIQKKNIVTLRDLDKRDERLIAVRLWQPFMQQAAKCWIPPMKLQMHQLF